MKVAVIFDRFGPYHIARLEAAIPYMNIAPIEISGETSEYQWDKVESSNFKEQITLFENTESKLLSTTEMRRALDFHLNRLKPDVVAINGWSERSALIALYWCLKNRVAAVLMSESGEEDGARIWWKEILKRTIVRQFGSALVGGIRHKRYLINLGLSEKQIFFGYDVIDNKHFEAGAKEARKWKQSLRLEKGLPQNYFLVVSRFIEKKNLPFIISAYHEYCKRSNGECWHLYILGDGHLKPQLVQLTKTLGLEHLVHFEGFKQYDELPIYFGLSKAFIHASTIEQWGLVVNEAMASGLPVIVSEKCGCVPELVQHGINGFVIDPAINDSLVQAMISIAAGEAQLKAMGDESIKIIAAHSSDAFGRGLWEAAKEAMSHKKEFGTGTALVLKTLINRSVY